MTLPLHRKYRPEDFGDMFGNATMLESLVSMMHREEKPTTYLLHGPSGCGKTTLARIMAEYLGCKKPREYNISDTRGIDAARSIIEKIWYHTFDVSRVIILNEVHMATKEFQNAMLEVLEEPPSATYFILCTTEPEKLLKTVLTRCTQFQVTELNRADMTKLLRYAAGIENIDIPTKVLGTIVKHSQGSPRQALTMLGKVIDIGGDEIDDIIQEVRTTDATVLELCRALAKNAKWKAVSKLLKDLKAEPEEVRYAILGYFTNVLLNEGDDRSAFVLSCFRESFIYSKRAGLVLSCYQAVELADID